MTNSNRKCILEAMKLRLVEEPFMMSTALNSAVGWIRCPHHSIRMPFTASEGTLVHEKTGYLPSKNEAA